MVCLATLRLKEVGATFSHHRSLSRKFPTLCPSFKKLMYLGSTFPLKDAGNCLVQRRSGVEIFVCFAAATVTKWLQMNRFGNYIKVFQHFSGKLHLFCRRGPSILADTVVFYCRVRKGVGSESVVRCVSTISGR